MLASGTTSEGVSGRWKQAWAASDALIAERGWLTPREVSLAVTKWGMVASLLLALLSCISHAYMKAEHRAVVWATVKWEDFVERVATDYGYVLPGPGEEPMTIEEWIERETIRIGLESNVKMSRGLPLALMWHESRRNHNAVSKKGAIGLFQLMPETIRWCGYTEEEVKKDPRKNATCGIRRLAYAMKKYGGDPFLAVQDYNGGPNCVGGYHEPIRCQESANEAREVIRLMSQDERV